MASSESRDPQVLIDAAGLGDIPKLESLIGDGSDVNGRGHCVFPEATALHAASLFGHADVAEVLIKLGADINAKNEMTPIYLKVSLKKMTVVNYKKNWMQYAIGLIIHY
ncbi:GA-binding protein subunit beta-2-like [Ptychodera flava]|uniref:GA-binding protein subunit beta-2-like n=1 Tax=Ptychodera flava TaxID=63121 RepID=UPI00396A061E